jgi:hypothetical protein
MTISEILRDYRLRYLRQFYSGAFSIASKYDFDDYFFFARDSTYYYTAMRSVSSF